VGKRFEGTDDFLGKGVADARLLRILRTVVGREKRQLEPADG